MIDKEALRKKYEAMKPPDLSPRASGAIWNTPQVTTITLSYCACGMSKWGDSETCERCIILDLLSERSRLASRVEELERALKLCMDVIWSEFHAGPEDAMNGDNEADIAFRAGQKVLAGAHAEEKE